MSHSRRMFRWITVCAAVLALLASSPILAAAPGWSVVPGSLSSGREFPAVVALPNGHVLVIGGQETSLQQSAAVDVYDASTHAWLARAASMHIGRTLAAVAMLQDGRVLVAGGLTSAEDGSNYPIASYEIYDPQQNTWTPPADAPFTVDAAAAITLSDGRVLVAGGLDESAEPVTATFLFDPHDGPNGTWSAGPNLITARGAAALTMLADHRVLISGGSGSDGAGIVTAEIFDPGSDSAPASIAPAGEMRLGRAFPVTVRLSDGRVLVAGGTRNSNGIQNSLSSVDIYDPASNTWSAAAPMTVSRLAATGGLLSDGTVVVAGGVDTSPDTGGVQASAEVYNPTSDSWMAVASMSEPRFAAGSVVTNGALFVAGGTADGATASSTAEVFVSRNNPPVAVATVPPTAMGVPGSNTAIAVSAAGSSDPDGDLFTYTWSEGASVLAVSTVPNATVGLPVGAHTLTLTVDDGFGGTATASAPVTVIDAIAGLQAQIAQLTARLQQAQQQLAAAEQVVTNAVALVQSSLRARFHDQSFTVPGATPEAQLQAIVEAVINLKNAGAKDLYEALTPDSHGDHGQGHDHGPHDGPGGHHGGGHPHP